MKAPRTERIVLTCTGCGFVVSVSRIESRRLGWYIAPGPPAVTLCERCVGSSGPGEPAGALLPENRVRRGKPLD